MLLTTRKPLQIKRLDTQHGIRGWLDGTGLKFGGVSRYRLEQQVRDQAEGRAMVTTITDAVQKAWKALREKVSPPTQRNLPHRPPGGDLPAPDDSPRCWRAHGDHLRNCV